eukprot:2191814-Amphidinium_carterae.1
MNQKLTLFTILPLFGHSPVYGDPGLGGPDMCLAHGALVTPRANPFQFHPFLSKLPPLAILA